MLQASEWSARELVAGVVRLARPMGARDATMAGRRLLTRESTMVQAKRWGRGQRIRNERLQITVSNARGVTGRNLGRRADAYQSPKIYEKTSFLQVMPQLWWIRAI